MKQEAAPRLEELLEHQSWLRQLATALVGSSADAEDLVQDTWLAALRSDSLRNADPRPWLGRVLRNRAASRWRTQESRVAREEHAAQSEALPSAADLAERADASRRLSELVLELPTDPQRILLLRYNEGLSSAEIARRLGRPPATVRSQLARSLTLLREKMDAQSEGDRARWMQALAPLSLAPSTGASVTGLAAAVPLTFFASVPLAALTAVLAVIALALALWFGGSPAPEAVPEAVVATESGDRKDSDAGNQASVTLRDGADGPERSTASDSAQRAPTAANGQGERAAASSTRAPVRGVLIDARNGKPVPWFELALVGQPVLDGTWSETSSPEERWATMSGVKMKDSVRLRTELDGSFETDGSLPAGTLQVIFLEDWKRIDKTLEWHVPKLENRNRSFEVAPGDGVATFEVAVGPGYRLDCPQLKTLEETEFAAILSDSARWPDTEFPPTHVEMEPEPFVRFPPLDGTRQRRSVTTLHLVSLDGRWLGSAPVKAHESTRLERVSLELRPAGELALELEVDSPPGPGSATFEVWEGHHEESDLERLEPIYRDDYLTFDESGMRGMTIKRLPAGLLTLRVQTLDFRDSVMHLELAQGKQSEAVSLTRTTSASGTIRGFVSAADGDLPPYDCVVYSNADGGDQRRLKMTALEFARDGDEWVASFTIEGLTQETHRLWIRPALGTRDVTEEHEVQPREVRVEPNGPPVHFRIEGQHNGTTLLVHATDAADGKVLESFRATAVLPASSVRPEPSDGEEGTATSELIGDRTGGRVWIRAEGYAPAIAMLEDALGNDQKLELNVALEPGWGAPISAFDTESHEPVADVEVFADGQSLGRTDADGVLCISLDRRPRVLAVAAAGYAVERRIGPIDADGSVHPEPDDPLEESFTFGLRPD